jgi:hypothetical protein
MKLQVHLSALSTAWWPAFSWVSRQRWGDDAIPFLSKLKSHNHHFTLWPHRQPWFIVGWDCRRAQILVGRDHWRPPWRLLACPHQSSCWTVALNRSLNPDFFSFLSMESALIYLLAFLSLCKLLVLVYPYPLVFFYSVRLYIYSPTFVFYNALSCEDSPHCTWYLGANLSTVLGCCNFSSRSL